MTKKSFFEKLTGASFSKEDSDEQEMEIDESEPIEENNENEEDTLLNEDTDVVEKESLKTESISVPNPSPKAQEIKAGAGFFKKKSVDTYPTNETKNELLVESEGQLTIDVYQTPNDIIIKSTIAGVEADNIDINITNDMITIKGNRQKDENVQENDYYYQECYWGSFSRSVILPVDVESDNASAAMKNGILTIRIPKAEKVKVKKIKITTE